MVAPIALVTEFFTKEVALVPGRTLFFHRYAITKTRTGTCKPQCCLPFDRLRKIIRRLMVVIFKKCVENCAPVHGRIEGANSLCQVYGRNALPHEGILVAPYEIDFVGVRIGRELETLFLSLNRSDTFER